MKRKETRKELLKILAMVGEQQQRLLDTVNVSYNLITYRVEALDLQLTQEEKAEKRKKIAKKVAKPKRYERKAPVVVADEPVNMKLELEPPAEPVICDTRPKMIPYHGTNKTQAAICDVIPDSRHQIFDRPEIVRLLKKARRMPKSNYPLAAVGTGLRSLEKRGYIAIVEQGRGKRATSYRVVPG